MTTLLPNGVPTEVEIREKTSETAPADDLTALLLKMKETRLNFAAVIALIDSHIDADLAKKLDVLISAILNKGVYLIEDSGQLSILPRLDSDLSESDLKRLNNCERIFVEREPATPVVTSENIFAKYCLLHTTDGYEFKIRVNPKDENSVTLELSEGQ